MKDQKKTNHYLQQRVKLLCSNLTHRLLYKRTLKEPCFSRLFISMEYFVISCWDYHLTRPGPLHCYTDQRWARARLSSVLRSCTASLSSHSSRHTSPCAVLASPANHSLSFANFLINIMNKTKRLTFSGLEFLEVAARVRTARTLPRPVCTHRALALQDATTSQ